MKKIFLLLSLLSCLNAFSQTYPFADGFEGQPSNQPPAGWGGSMKVLLNHGLNDLKAICGRVSSAVTVDSAITPLVGPLTSSTSMTFYYRIIDQANYPSTPTNLDVNDQVEIMLSTDGVNYQTVYLIDLNNHNPSFNFSKKKVFLTQFAGSTVNFKIRCQYGTGASFFVDIDTVTVANDPQAGIEDLKGDVTFSLFPNPCTSNTGCTLHFEDSKQYPVKVFNALGQQVYYSPGFANLSHPAFLSGSQLPTTPPVFTLFNQVTLRAN